MSVRRRRRQLLHPRRRSFPQFVLLSASRVLRKGTDGEANANHVHQYHGLHGEEARRILKQKKLATPAQVREHYRRRRPETGSGDIRAVFGQQTPAAGVSKATAASIVREKGKAGIDFWRKGKGKSEVEEASEGMTEGEGKHDSDGVEGSLPQESGTQYMGKDTEPFLEGFETFLKSRVEGKNQSATPRGRNAKGIVVNASKYLYCDQSPNQLASELLR